MFDPSTPITIRNLPPEMRLELVREAERNARSLDDEVVARLRASLRGGGVRLGILKGQLGTAPDFTEPLSEDDLAAWEGNVAGS